MFRAVVCLVALAAVLPGCAGRRLDATAAPPSPHEALARSSKERQARAQAFAVTVESWDERLKLALAELAVRQDAAAHRRVAEEYRRLRVFDTAYEHFEEAVRLDPADAAAPDGMARIWRDWGFPRIGLTYSLRAVELAPASPVAANTTGTLYAAVGQFDRAEEWYARALALDPEASYALNNFCYAAVRLGRRGAVDACERAVHLRPESTAVRNNLGLAYAAGGDLTRARAEFAHAGEGAAHYNLGMVFLAQKRFVDAVSAFRAAQAAEPGLPQAAARVRQSRALAGIRGERDGDSD